MNVDLCTMLAWGKGRGAEGAVGYIFAKVAPLFVGRQVGVGLGVVVRAGAICLL